ncbi:hypothetical protein BIFCAT_00685 [Bifidobacterium catenulatum DSM 16992 = JCM 1194 = LMG 11043]|uniref:Uncharacterized protein n=1 Tax=Bifidobacterium catenulatum DSM 16992 = JCM 1194 = LMG 11043 TaxID=566552 RepID=B6XUX2_9BIFI|nr:hypothetical protein BIFCAT_00685 [Bifidobacterium catenulatum DSM 16992 = JCM 1194 = LMG 11043]
MASVEWDDMQFANRRLFPSCFVITSMFRNALFPRMIYARTLHR